jgi:predicted alpha/beta superfamily hydrolase
MSHVLFGLTFASLLFTLGCTSTHEDGNAATHGTGVATSSALPPVELDSSEIFEIFSPTNNQHYRIRARLPASYPSDTQKHYPVIIKLDGQWDFLLAASAYNCVYFDGQMPETVIIGIDWGDIEGDIHAIRSRDLLPRPIGRYPNSGQASTFVKVIADEIIPALEKRYRLDGKRFLLGGSWSGVFATYALLENPAAFDGAIAIGPAYEIGGEVMQQQIEAASQSQAFNGKRLYIGIGKWDPVAPSVLDYAKALTDANVKGLEFKLDHLEGFGHSGMNIPGYAGGYQHIFRRPRPPVDIKKLQSLAGVYQMENSDDTMVVSAQNQELVVQFSSGETYHLWPHSETHFYHPGVFYNLSFSGELASVETFFGKSRYRRVHLTTIDRQKIIATGSEGQRH